MKQGMVLLLGVMLLSAALFGCTKSDMKHRYDKTFSPVDCRINAGIGCSDVAVKENTNNKTVQTTLTLYNGLNRNISINELYINNTNGKCDIKKDLPFDLNNGQSKQLVFEGNCYSNPGGRQLYQEINMAFNYYQTGNGLSNIIHEYHGEIRKTLNFP